MAKSVWRRASQSRPLLGKSVGFIQSPCSRQRMRIFVSARLHAAAAPEAPEPMIRTSTFSLSAISAVSLGGSAVVAPELCPAQHRGEPRPVSLSHVVSFREWSAGLVPDGEQDAGVAIVGAQDHPPEGRGRN